MILQVKALNRMPEMCLYNVSLYQRHFQRDTSNTQTLDNGILSAKCASEEICDSFPTI